MKRFPKMNSTVGKTRLFTFCSLLLMFWAVLRVSGLLAGTPRSGIAYATVQLGKVTPHLEAYGQVRPITVLPVTAAEPGVVTGLNVVPGMQVRAGDVLARLTGPEIETMLLQGQADVRSSQAQLVSSRESLAILRQQLITHLSTRQAVHQAEGALAQAKTNFDNAQSHLQSVRQLMTLTSPMNSTVLTLSATDGQLVSTGQPILTLQISGELWLRAAYYGAEISVIRVGMRGTFTPADGSENVPVRVREVFAPLAAGGGESISLVLARPGFSWANGEYGTVNLDLPKRTMVAVPTRSLIMDQGKWWVLVHTAHGDRPQEVVPGPARGWQTFLKSGLKPGAQVVVENAYFLFHRGIAQNYKPPVE